jgi:hypothetical protein
VISASVSCQAQSFVGLSEATLLLTHMQVCLQKGDYRLYNACIAAVKVRGPLRDLVR